jgi:hypothetical protein
MIGDEGKKLQETIYAEVLEALKKDVPEVAKIAEGNF